jgi:aspartokinase-like uncharacterized kinase
MKNRDEQIKNYKQAIINKRLAIQVAKKTVSDLEEALERLQSECIYFRLLKRLDQMEHMRQITAEAIAAQACSQHIDELMANDQLEPK